QEALHGLLEHRVAHLTHALGPDAQNKQADEVDEGEQSERLEESERAHPGEDRMSPRGAEQLAEPDLHVLAHHLAAALDVDLAEYRRAIAQDDGTLIDGRAAQNAHRVAFHDTVRLQLDRAAH